MATVIPPQAQFHQIPDGNQPFPGQGNPVGMPPQPQPAFNPNANQGFNGTDS
jgi:hypothetical protein